MKKLLLGGLLLLPALAYAGGNLVGGLGNRKLQDDALDGFDSHTAFGVLADFGFGNSPVNLATGLLVSSKQQDGVTLAVADIMVGAKFMGHRGVFRPYAETGLVSTGVSIEAFGESDSDQTFAFYGALGAIFRLGKHFDLGGDLRLTKGGSVDFGGEIETDSFTATVFAGFGWGS